MTWPENITDWPELCEACKRTLTEQAGENEMAYRRAERIESFERLGFVWPMRRPTPISTP